LRFRTAAIGDIDVDDAPDMVFGKYFNDEKIHALNMENGASSVEYSTGSCNNASQ